MSKASTELLEQGTQTPSPAPDLIPAQTENQPRTHIGIGTANGGTSQGITENEDGTFQEQEEALAARLKTDNFAIVIQRFTNGAVSLYALFKIVQAIFT
jgi:hypothetical protein